MEPNQPIRFQIHAHCPNIKKSNECNKEGIALDLQNIKCHRRTQILYYV